MIFFGHVGLTAAVVKGYEKIVQHCLKKPLSIDYRFVMIGSVLPDLIDKPIGAWLFRNTFHNSRIIGHTFLLVMLLILFGVFLLRQKKQQWLLLLGVGSAFHLIFDSMWDYSGTLFWPLFGFKFPERAEGDWLEMSFEALLHNPAVFLPELVGAAILIFFFIRLMIRKQLLTFIKEGKL